MEEAAAASPALALPSFTATNPAPWFQRVEALFRLKGITSDGRKADYVIGALPADVFDKISHWLDSKGSDTILYSELKPAVIRLCEPSAEEKGQRILELMRTPLGDQRPSDALRELWSLSKVLLPDGTTKPLDLVRLIWMTRLPAELRPHISDFAARSDEELLRLADSVQSTSRLVQPSAAIHQVAPPSPEDDDAVLAAKRRYVHPRANNGRPASDVIHKTLCYYHRRFGKDARSCRPPCHYSKNL